jgi:putative oxidoreductase
MNDGAKLLLRLALGGLILLHGIAKLRGGIGSIVGMVGAAGLPPWVAYCVYAGELLAPAVVLAGWYARAGAAIIAVNMLFAVGLAHRSDFLVIGPTGGWALELQGLYFATAVAVALLGPGRFGINRS